MITGAVGGIIDVEKTPFHADINKRHITFIGINDVETSMHKEFQA